ncbi:DUF885 domain-containing protein [Chitinimonas lacunae]|uniref:DUF885 domain-containing protein n=1 Tax=Chitinimonas lacunae TaxID=1963018 RepID=A0ABV8MVJ2_9NEIS
MTLSVQAIGAELLQLRLEFDPLDDALRMVASDVGELPQMSDAWLAERASRLSALSAALSGAGTADDLIGAGVARLQALDLGQKLDMRLWATFVSGYDHSPLGRVTGGLPSLPLGQAEERERFTELFLSSGRYVASCIDGTVAAARSQRAPMAWSVQTAAQRWKALLAEDGVSLIPEAASAEFRRELSSEFRRRVAPQIARYVDMLETTILPLARPDDQPGLCHIRSGSSDYEQLVVTHTDDFASVDEIHRLGEAEVTRIRERICQLTGSQTPNLDEFLAGQGADFSGVAEVIEHVNAVVARARKDFAHLVEMAPVGPLDIEHIPEHLSDFSPIAYYLPSGRGEASGKLLLNVHRLAKAKRGKELAMLVHEAIPGHHVQFEYAKQAGLPAFRTSAWFNSFIEGWGLYAEELAEEADYYQTAAEKIGKLQMELLRASRLVVDTGLHYYGWSSARAEEYLQNMTLLKPAFAKSEVRRYTEYPGQALSYTAGRLQLTALREKQRSRLGQNFDMADFHRNVLRHGTIPISVLSKVLEETTA